MIVMVDFEWGFLADEADVQDGRLYVAGGLASQAMGRLPGVASMRLVARCWYRQSDVGSAHRFVAESISTGGDTIFECDYQSPAIFPQPDIHDPDHIPLILVLEAVIGGDREGNAEVRLSCDGESLATFPIRVRRLPDADPRNQ